MLYQVFPILGPTHTGEEKKKAHGLSSSVDLIFSRGRGRGKGKGVVFSSEERGGGAGGALAGRKIRKKKKNRSIPNFSSRGRKSTSQRFPGRKPLFGKKGKVSCLKFLGMLVACSLGPGRKKKRKTALINLRLLTFNPALSS